MTLLKSALLLPCLLLACGPQYVERVAAPGEVLPARQAFFAQRPDALDEAFRASCAPPIRAVRQITRDTVQCRIIPRPEAAAYLLLNFDGALEAPSMVVQKRTRRAEGGYLVELSYFAEVTQKSGYPRRIYESRRDMDRLLDRLLESTGGTPR